MIAWQTPWVQKAWSLMGLTDPVRRTLSKYLHQRVLRDSQTCRWVQSSDLQALSANEEEEIPEEDLYLVQVYHAAKADMIVTSDTVFHDAAAKLGIPIVLRDEFIRQYLGGA